MAFLNESGLQRFWENIVSKFVRKVDGKDLSSNDFTDEEKEKLTRLENYTLPVAISDALGGIKSGGDITINSAGIVTVNNSDKAESITIPRVTSDILELACQQADFTECVYFCGSDGVSYNCPETYCILKIQRGQNGRTIIDCYALNTQNHYTNGNMMAHPNEAERDKWTGWTKWAKESFKNVAVGSTTIAADAGDDTLTLVAGSNVTLTPDATNDKITIAATDTTYSAATTSAAGLMSAADKTKLDGIATEANKYTLPVAGTAIGGVKSGGDITVGSDGAVTVNEASIANYVENSGTPKSDAYLALVSSYDSETISLANPDSNLQYSIDENTLVAPYFQGDGSKLTNLNAAYLAGSIPTSLLPSYVDDVIEATSTDGFPLTGEAGKIYVDTTSNKTYRWSGSQYTEISPSLALGSTSSTAYRGDYGAAAYKHAVTNKGIAKTSGLYKITTNSEGHVTAATAVTKADITGLGIPAQDTIYTLPAASASLGGVKSGGDVSINNGTITVNNARFLYLGTLGGVTAPDDGMGGPAYYFPIVAAGNYVEDSFISLENNTDIYLTNAGTLVSPAFSGNGSELTNLSATALTGTIAAARLPEASTNAKGAMTAAMVTKLNGITDSADSVSFTQNLTSGEKIGTININGVNTEIFAPKTSVIYISTSEPESTAAGQDGDLWMVVES